MDRPILSSASADEARAELLREIYAPILLALVPPGYVLIALTEILRWPQQVSIYGIGLMLLPLVLWPLLRRYALLGSWVLVSTYTVVILLSASLLPSPVVLGLLVLPILWATLMISSTAGLALAGLATIVVFASGRLWNIQDLVGRLIALLTIWGSTVAVWTTARFATEALKWSWAHYQGMAQSLAEARDQRVTLKQVRDDLLQANTELTRVSDRLEVMRRLAEQARRAKEDFAANVSHELRTPLNMIIGFSELLSQAPETYGLELPPALLADVAVIHRNSQHLASLINDVLDLSQMDRQRLALRREPCRLGDVVRAAVEAVRPLYETKGLYLRSEVPADLAPIPCDRTRIRQVILNLLSNAGRFTERGGVSLRITDEGHQVTLSVADTGPGISVEDCERIFEPFRQAGDSVLQRHDGSGLGLSISRRFVELHGGRMWVQSELGVGSVFHFALPREDALLSTAMADSRRWFEGERAYEARSRPSAAPLPEIHPRVVVMEPGNALQRLVRSAQAKAEIIPVRDPQQALAALAHAPAQALLINDPAAEHSTRAWAWLSDLPYGTPALVCSAPSEEDFSAALGVSRYLVKPVARDSLLASLRTLGRPIHTILLVDDQPEALQLFARMLSSANEEYRILRALDGVSALDLARRRHPDVILLDLLLPAMSGYDVLKAKALDPLIRDIPVIVLTAQDPAQHLTSAHPVVIGRGGGLAFAELLDYLLALGAALMPASPSNDRELPATPRGSPAF